MDVWNNLSFVEKVSTHIYAVVNLPMPKLCNNKESIKNSKLQLPFIQAENEANTIHRRRLFAN